MNTAPKPGYVSWKDPRTAAMHSIANLKASDDWVEGVKKALYILESSK